MPITKTYQCLQCGSPLMGQRRKYCGTKCRNKHRARERLAARHEVLFAKERHCEACGDPFKPDAFNAHKAVYCSQQCKASDYREKNPGKVRMWWKARDARTNTPGAEKFDPHEVLARDGWRCHICGRSTPKRLRGTTSDRAPELDHIIPLAAGGLHTRQNTACACRKCNRVKGAKPLGQLRLIA